jgi:hypothetical protein
MVIFGWVRSSVLAGSQLGLELRALPFEPGDDLIDAFGSGLGRNQSFSF